MLKITFMPPDGKSYTKHFKTPKSAKSFLDRLFEQSGVKRAQAKKRVKASR